MKLLVTTLVLCLSGCAYDNDSSGRAFPRPPHPDSPYRQSQEIKRTIPDARHRPSKKAKRAIMSGERPDWASETWSVHLPLGTSR